MLLSELGLICDKKGENLFQGEYIHNNIGQFCIDLRALLDQTNVNLVQDSVFNNGQEDNFGKNLDSAKDK